MVSDIWGSNFLTWRLKWIMVSRIGGEKIYFWETEFFLDSDRAISSKKETFFAEA